MRRMSMLFKNIKNVPSKTDQAELALAQVKKLHEEGKLREALHEIDRIEENFPSCTKATKYYRGKIAVEFLEESGRLPKIQKKH